MHPVVLTVVAALVLTVAPTHAPIDPALDKVLRQLDAASTQFKSVEADLKWDSFEKVVRDTTTQTGSIYFTRSNGSIVMGAVITQPGKKYVRFAQGKGEYYDAISRKATPINAGANRNRLESALALGFGSSGKEIEESYTATLQGSEKVDGITTVKLDLVPKDPATAQTFTHIQMWIDTTRDVPLKQICYMPEGDTRTAYYTNIRYNAKIDLKRYKH